jgi:hypothetical protein
MTTTITRMTAVALVAAAFSAAAHAEYRCSPAKTWMDREACEAARQGPDELRRFVQRMESIRVNLNFYDYVDLKTAQAWGARHGLLAEQKDAPEAATQLSQGLRP